MPVKSMYCEKCGKELPQNSMFCLHCGQPVTPEEKAKQKREKRKRKAAFWLIGLASVLFVAGVLVAVFFADIMAWAERLVLSPEMLMKKAIAVAAQDMGANTGGSGTSLETPRRYSAELYLDEALQEILFASEDDVWLSNLQLGLAAGKDGDLQRMELALLVKEEPIVSFDLVQNADKAWLGAPGLNSRYLEFSKVDLGLGQMDTLPNGREMEKLARTYAEILLDGIHRVTKENTKLEIDGVSQKVLKLTATIGPEDARQIFSQLAEELETDETVKDLLNQWAGENSHSELVAAIQTLAAYADREVSLICYLDNHNKLIGFALEDEKGNTLFYWAKAVRSGEFASLLTCGELSLSGKGTCSAGKKTGQYCLRVDGETLLSYQLKDFSVTKNGFSGSVFFPVPRSLTDNSILGLFDAEMGVELHQESVSGKQMLTINLQLGGKAYFGLILTEEKMNDFSVDIPKAVVPAKEDTIEIWFQSFDCSAVEKKLAEAGVPINGWRGLQ